MIDILYLIVGLVGMWVGTELVVNGATSLAKQYHIKESFIGLSVLAFGTDLPELSIMLSASVTHGGSDEGAGIILGSAVGSAIAQISIVLGSVGLIGKLYMVRSQLVLHGTILVSATLLLFVLTFDGVLSRLDGITLVVCFLGYYIFLIKGKHYQEPNPSKSVTKSAIKAWVLLIPGFVLLLGNAELTVNAALSIATTFGLSSSAVAAIIIGFGSSLPELSLSSMALARKKTGLSLGNLIGSNILDTLLIPGIAASITALTVAFEVAKIDLPVLLGVTVFALYALTRSKEGIKKSHVIILLVSYFLYAAIRFGKELFPGLL